jgi:hypothetical protein
MGLAALMDTVARYADARDLLAHAQVARAERDRLLHQVELRWETPPGTAWRCQPAVLQRQPIG